MKITENARKNARIFGFRVRLEILSGDHKICSPVFVNELEYKINYCS